MKKKTTLLLITVFFIVFPACSHRHDELVQAEPDDHIHLHLSKQRMQEWGIETGRPGKRAQVTKVNLPGTVVEDLKASARVHLLLPGSVLEIKSDIGDRVRPGQVLCRLHSPAFSALKADYLAAFQEHFRAEADFQRASELLAVQALERREWLERQTNFKRGLVLYLDLEKRLSGLGLGKAELEQVRVAQQAGEIEKIKSFMDADLELRAPLAGLVLERDLAPGQALAEGHLVYTIADTARLWALLDLPERDVDLAVAGSSLELFRSGREAEALTAEILLVHPKLQDGSRTFRLRAGFANPGQQLKPGMFVYGSLRREQENPWPALPDSALVKIDGHDGVFVRSGDDGFDFRPLRVVARDDDGYVFIEGLALDEEVVLKGAYYLKAEAEMERAGDDHHGHQH